MITQIFASINLPADGIESGPIVCFKDVTPIYLKANFHQWCEIGLAEIGAIRPLEDKVIRFMQLEFMGLINAVYCMAAAMADRENAFVYYDEYTAKYYKKIDEEENRLSPQDFCRYFFRKITCRSARSILWLMFEVVTAHREKYEYQPQHKDILSLFHRYFILIGAADAWQKALNKGGCQTKKRKPKPGAENTAKWN
jgi:hypothetical protein